MMKRSSILKSERLKSASSDVLFIFAKIKTWQKIEKFKKVKKFKKNILS